MVGWERKGDMPAAANIPSPVTELVAFRGGYVAIGPSGIWLSPNGRDWALGDLPEAGVANSIASNGHQLVAVGWVSREPCRPPEPVVVGSYACSSSPVSWVSDDGLTWQSPDPWSGPADPTGGDRGSEFSGVMAVPGGGWEAWIGFHEGAAVIDSTRWRSPDGLTWEPLDEQPPLTPAYGSLVATVGPGDDRLVWESDYGLPNTARFWRWTDDAWFGRPLPDEMVVSSMLAPETESGPWLMAGFTPRDGAWVPAVWTSTSLDTWAEIILPHSTPGFPYPVRLLRLDAGYLLFGSEWNGAVGTHATWHSQDGQTWSQVTSTEFGPAVAAFGPAGVIGVGIAGSEKPLGVWSLITE